MAFDSLIEKIKEKHNPTVVGLDPKLEYVPEFIIKKNFEKYGECFEAAANSIFEFNKGIIDNVYDLVPAVKPQSAYYEMYGWWGVKALHDTIFYAKSRGLYVITDAKRNDIGATMQSYATAYLGKTHIGNFSEAAFDSDALTVNGYLGIDGINPLLDLVKDNDKGIFVLAKTSNPSGKDLQDRVLDDGKTVYETMGDYCEKWGAETIGKYGYSAVGAVVGATYPKQLCELREKLPHTFFLIPGYGAQGGGAEGVAEGFDKSGLGAIVNSSRKIICAYKNEKAKDEENFAKYSRNEVLRMRDDILSHINL